MPTSRRFRTLLLAAVIASGCFARASLAEFPTTRPYQKVQYVHEERTDPPQQIHAVVLDLAGETVALRVAPGGPDPDGEGKWQTTLMPVSAVAEREGFDACINGDFFAVTRPAGESDKDVPPEKRGYVRDMWATVSGPAATDGRVWAPTTKPRPSLIVDRRGRVAIMPLRDVPDEAVQVIAGSDIVVERGKNVARTEGDFAKTRHPRTAVGIGDNGRKLVLVVVDGRQKDRAAGMTLSELADVMLGLGCETALNLDGGGSTTLVMRDRIAAS